MMDTPMSNETESLVETRTVHDPILNKDVEVSDKLTDRLRGRYASGPRLPNGEPEFGWREFPAPQIQHEAAAVIESMDRKLAESDAERTRLVQIVARMLESADDRFEAYHAMTNRALAAESALANERDLNCQAIEELKECGHCGEGTSEKIARQRRNKVLDEAIAAIRSRNTRAKPETEI